MLGKIQREAMDNNVPIIPPEMVRLLSVILKMAKPKNILEIGTAVGFSAGLMCSFLEDGGKVTTIDRYEVLLKKAKENINRLELEDKIEIIEGDAANVLPNLQGPFDVVFLDAAKGQYINFLPHCLRLLKPGGVLIADDVLHHGNVTKDVSEIARRQRTIHKRMREFLFEITNNPKLETCILPIGDGVSISYKKEV